VPGISPSHPEMDGDPIGWVGVSGEDGTFRGVHVDPETSVLKNTVKFEGRSTNDDYLRPKDIKDEEW